MNTEKLNPIDQIKPLFRDETLDIIKGILILLVVVFHSNFTGSPAQPTLVSTNDFTFSFMMPMFCLISGYLSPLKKLTSQRCVRLILPYVLLSVVYIFGLQVASRFGVATTNHAAPVTVSSLLRMIFFDPVGPYWYLHALIYYVVVLDLIARAKERVGIYYALAIGLLGLVGMLFAGVILYSLIFFSIGTFMRLFRPYKHDFGSGLLGVVALMSSLVIFGWSAIMDRGSVASIIWTLGATLILYLLFQSGAQAIGLKWLNFLGKQSLVIFLFHPFSMQISNLVGKKLANGVIPAAFAICLAMVLNVILCLLVASVARLLPGGKMLLGENSPLMAKA